MSRRILSLLPSGTEIVAALGAQEELVGRSHECDFPPGIEALPICCSPRIDVGASSLQIDQQVRQAVHSALSIYQVDTDLINQLQPTHIITQTQCDVCAVSLQDVEQALCQVIDSRPVIVSLEPMTLADLWNTILQTATALGEVGRGQVLVEQLQQRLDDIAAIPAGRPLPTVLCLEWIEPLMSAGNWVPELVTRAGGLPVLCEAGKHSPYFGWDKLLAADPEIIVLMPCGFSIARTLAELTPLTAHPGWSQLRAVREQRVYVTDGHQYFNRPGPRLVDSAEILAEIFAAASSPQRSSPRDRYRGEGWIALPPQAGRSPADLEE